MADSITIRFKNNDVDQISIPKNIIIIRFKNNDVDQISIPKNIINQYPNSAIYGYLELSNTNTITLEDISYTDFCIVAQVLKKQLKQWQVSFHILAYMDRNGLVDDNVNRLQSQLISGMHTELDRFDKFINGTDDSLIIHNTDLYNQMESILKGNTNFVSVQTTINNGRLVCIHLNGLLPIYTCGPGFYGCVQKNILFPKTEVIDLFHTRENMFYVDDPIKYSKALTHEPTKAFYSTNMFTYLGEIHHIVSKVIFSETPMVAENKRAKETYFDFSSNFNELACQNIKQTIEKIIAHIVSLGTKMHLSSLDPDTHIMKSRIVYQFEVNGSGYEQPPFTTFGFINLNNLLTD